MTVQVCDGVASITAGDVLLTLWAEPAREARIRHVTRVATDFLARTEGSIVAAQFLLPSAGPPRWSERAAIQEGIDLVFPRARRLVTTPLGDAAWQAVVRGVMRIGVTVLGKARVVKIAASPAEAMGHLLEARSPLTPPERELDAALGALSEALGAPLRP
jgi:hypothetical protein